MQTNLKARTESFIIISSNNNLKRQIMNDHSLRLFENGQRGLGTFLLQKENNLVAAE